MPVYNKFTVNLRLTGMDAFDKLKGRIMDLRKVWNEVIPRWLNHNEEKFEEGRGAQLMGVEFDAEGESVFWLGVTDDYAAKKTSDGFPNWLMVRTGALREELTSRDGLAWWEDLDMQEARFGTLDMKAMWNIEKRPVMFLDTEDRQMIQDMVGAYFNGQPPFQMYRPSAVKEMDAQLRMRTADPRA